MTYFDNAVDHRVKAIFDESLGCDDVEQVLEVTARPWVGVCGTDQHILVMV